MEDNPPILKQYRKWDSSIAIAIVAVLISSVSTYIGLKESEIMLEQQKISLDKQAASVWPYIEHIPSITILSETKVEFEYIVINKGVGPAIIDSVHYMFEGKGITGWGLDEELQIKYPNYKISGISNGTLDGRVLAPGERHSVLVIEIENTTLSSNGDVNHASNEIREDIINEKDNTISALDILNKLEYHLEYCYCSIYGKCWKVSGNYKRKVSEECFINEDIY